MDGTWTIGELAERAGAALAADGSTQVSGRVRDVPNERLIRWYTTIGLLDPPLGRRGRTALYGPRHLLQLVAVKRRQAAGRSIAEIQTELTGATDATLQRIAALPSPAAAPIDAPAPPEATLPTNSAGPATDTARTSAAPAHDDRDGPRSTFWRTRPDVSYTEATVAGDYGGPDASGDPSGSAFPPTVVQGVRLTSGLTLLLDVPALDGEDLAAIETAARPLLDELRRRGLLSPPASLAYPPADPSRRFQ